MHVWAPNAYSVELVAGDEKSFVPPIALERTTVSYRGAQLPGYWRVRDGTSVLKDGDGYWFKIIIENGETRYRVDPYARAMNHSNSYSIHKDTTRFQWTDEDHRPPARGEMVIYQLFQGGYVGRGDSHWLDRSGQNCHFTWGPTKKGDFTQLRKKLDYIQSLGVNTIELLPINEFNGDNYIGYSSVTFFAVEASYGGSGNGSSYDDLKAFINDAHSRNISVLADVVFNHFGTAGDSGPLWNFDSTTRNIYFSGDKAFNQMGGDFGEAPNWARWEVQKYIEDACNYYLEELHFDGLRFDFTSQIVNKNLGSSADSGAEALRRIVHSLKAKHPEKVLICEHWDANLGDYNPWMMTYVGFDAGWLNFRKELHKALQPFAHGVEESLAYAINGGDYPHAHSRVIYANNHDECWWDGNPAHHNKFYPVTQLGWRGDYWSKKKARMVAALSFFVPGIPLFFMGDEFAMEGSFNDARKEHILNWELENLTPGDQFKEMFRRLIQIRQTYDQLKQAGTTFEWLHYPKDGWFAFKRKWGAAVLIVTGNFTGSDMWGYGIPTNGEAGNWTQIFNSDGSEFGGDGVGNFLNEPSTEGGVIRVNIPRNGIVVMNRMSI